MKIKSMSQAQEHLNMKDHKFVSLKFVISVDEIVTNINVVVQGMRWWIMNSLMMTGSIRPTA
jgi:hypothetical protein